MLNEGTAHCVLRNRQILSSGTRQRASSMESEGKGPRQANRCDVSRIVGWIVTCSGIFTFFLLLVTVRDLFLGEVSWSAYEMTARNAGNEEPPPLSHVIEREERSRPASSLASPNRRVPRRTSSGVAGRHLATRGRA